MTSSDHDPESLHHYPHPSSRSAVLATEGVVATSQPLAAQAGLGVLADGGSAVDAAIATAAALTVVEPCSNGLGSDAFAIVWDGTKLHGLNGSGRWPSANRADELRASGGGGSSTAPGAGTGTMPERGWGPVTVPGAVDSWGVLHQRFGRLPIERLLQPAIRYAERGYPVSPVVARQWEAAARFFPSLGLEEVADWATVFTPGGRAPRAGEQWASGGHARCLRRLVDGGWRDFYEGEVAEAIAAYATTTGGRLSLDDLAAHQAEWVDPISVAYNGCEVWEIPPNGQGIAALMALGVAANTPAATHPRLSAGGWHYQIEAMKLAFADTDSYVADQQHQEVPVAGMLAPDYLKTRAELITEQAGDPARGEPRRGGTVYLCAADRDGMMVSFIQSNYMGFGSGIVVPSHGVSLQNRGAGFVLHPDHPNVAAPDKRPRHTIIPGFLTRGGRAVGPFGVMGGEMQPQGHLQVISGMVDHGLNPQAVLDAPRWQVERDWTVKVEAETPNSVVSGLRARGHRVDVERSRMSFGRGQIIIRSEDGVYAAGSEPRADGCAVGI
ncbi:MAG: gamma-glutamyltransferase family protein [Actinomycetia bacterium]|nr:gamma-glutamyltransferase family protein [Actinomycetes bacterium]